MASETFLKTRGLVTNINTALAPGDLRQADNVVIRRAGIIEPRRGYIQVPMTQAPLGQTLNYLFQDAFGNMYAIFGNGNLYAIDGVQPLNLNSVPKYYAMSGAGQSLSTTNNWLPFNNYGGLAGIYTRSANMNGNAYVATTGGTCVVLNGNTGTPTNSTLRRAGIPRALDLSLTGVTSTSGFMPNNTGVAYRVVWGILDTQNNLVLGFPSGRAVYYNTSGGAQNIQLTIRIPPLIVTDIATASNPNSYIYQVYKTSVSAAGAGLSSIPDPGDQMNLVYQNTVQTPQTNNQVVFTDIVPDGYNKGQDLYTNPQQGGIQSGNYMPPICGDIQAFKGTMFYAYTSTVPRISAAMTGIPYQLPIAACSVAANVVTLTLNLSNTPFSNLSAEGFGANAYISVQGCNGTGINGDFNITGTPAANQVTYNSTGAVAATTFGTAMTGDITFNGSPVPTITRAQASYTTESGPGSATTISYKVATSGSTTQNIQQTIASLVRAFNNQGSNFLLFAGNSPSDAPGLFYMEASAMTSSSTASAALGGVGATWSSSFWVPSLGSAQTTSKSDLSPSRLYYSKPGQPEHVPITNYFDVGDKQAPILRIIANRDSLFIFKLDGIFRLNGDPNFGSVPTRFDDTVILMYPNMAALCHNRIYAVTVRGVCEVSDIGVRWVSQNVQDVFRGVADTLSLGGQIQPNTASCLACEAEGVVEFALSVSGSTSVGEFLLTYNVDTQSWTSAINPTTLADNPRRLPGITCVPQRGAISATGFLPSQIYRHSAQGASLWAQCFNDGNANISTGPMPTAQVGLFIPGDMWSGNATVVSTNVVTWAYSGSASDAPTGTPAVGDALIIPAGLSSNSFYYYISAVNGSNLTLTPTGSPATNVTSNTQMMWIRGNYTVEWLPFSGANDAEAKHFMSAAVLIDGRSNFDTFQVNTYTEIAPTVTVGQFPGAGYPTIPVTVARTFPASTQARARRLSVIFKCLQAARIMLISGVSYEYSKQAVTREGN